jgi:hypothetical protein
MSHDKGEGPVKRDEAKDRVKAFFDKPEHKLQGPNDERDKRTKNDDLRDAAVGGIPNPDFE